MNHICYAIVKNGVVQLDTRDKSLEIYDNIYYAEVNCPDDMEITRCFIEFDSTKKKEAFEAIWDSVTDLLLQKDIDKIERLHKREFAELCKE